MSCVDNAPRRIAAWLASGVGLLHLFYASQGGIAQTPGAAWLLALGTAAGAALVWWAALRGPWAFAWLGLVLGLLPPALNWPAIGVSAGGLLALLLLALEAVAILAASLRKSQTSGEPTGP